LAMAGSAVVLRITPSTSEPIEPTSTERRGPRREAEERPLGSPERFCPCVIFVMDQLSKTKSTWLPTINQLFVNSIEKRCFCGRHGRHVPDRAHARHCRQCDKSSRVRVPAVARRGDPACHDVDRAASVVISTRNVPHAPNSVTVVQGLSKIGICATSTCSDAHRRIPAISARLPGVLMATSHAKRGSQTAPWTWTITQGHAGGPPQRVLRSALA
jgi:hypothetical protein